MPTSHQTKQLGIVREQLQSFDDDDIKAVALMGTLGFMEVLMRPKVLAVEEYIQHAERIADVTFMDDEENSQKLLKILMAIIDGMPQRDPKFITRRAMLEICVKEIIGNHTGEDQQNLMSTMAATSKVLQLDTPGIPPDQVLHAIKSASRLTVPPHLQAESDKIIELMHQFKYGI